MMLVVLAMSPSLEVKSTSKCRSVTKAVLLRSCKMLKSLLFIINCLIVVKYSSVMEAFNVDVAESHSFWTISRLFFFMKD